MTHSSGLKFSRMYRRKDGSAYRLSTGTLKKPNKIVSLSQCYIALDPWGWHTLDLRSMEIHGHDVCWKLSTVIGDHTGKGAAYG